MRDKDKERGGGDREAAMVMGSESGSEFWSDGSNQGRAGSALVTAAEIPSAPMKANFIGKWGKVEGKISETVWTFLLVRSCDQRASVWIALVSVAAEFSQQTALLYKQHLLTVVSQLPSPFTAT